MRYGASPNNYKDFQFERLTAKERSTFLTYRKNKRLMQKYNDSKKIVFFQDKYKFANIFKMYYGRKFYLNTLLKKEELVALSSNKKIIYKPLKGGQGRGIKTYIINSDNIERVLKEVVNLPEGIVEEWIKQHVDMDFSNNGSINPIRIQTLNVDGNVHIVASTITLSNGTEIANASEIQSIFALVDINNGIVKTNGYDYNGNNYIEHPQSKRKIFGFQIPFWNETIELVKKAANVIPEVGHIGWDIAITQVGPIIIEGNNDPGYTAYQLSCFNSDHMGMMKIYEKYL